MEFKFRAGDHRPPPPSPPPRCASPRLPAVYCLYKQGFPGVDRFVRRNTSMIAMRNPFDTNEAAARLSHQMELILLREEKLMLEIQRQRFLNEEARRQLMLFEREIAIRGVSQSAAGCSFGKRSRWGAPAPVAVVQPPFNERQVQPLMAVAGKEGQVLQADKRALVVLEKPNPNVFREKRKAETPLITTNDIQPFGVMKNPNEEWSCALCQVTATSEKRKAETPLISTNDIQPFGVTKNPNEEWSCALCQVTATSESTFKQHLHGKKHKRKEEGLRTRKASKVSQATPMPLPSKRMKLHRATETSGSEGAKQPESKVGESLQCEKLDAKEEKQQSELMIEQKLISKNVIVGKKKFKFWCEKCKVGAFATEVMFNHLNGRKHKANHQEGS